MTDDPRLGKEAIDRVQKLPEIQGKLAAHEFLIETAFASIFSADAFEQLAAAIRARLRSHPINPNAATLGEIAISDETERQLLQFLENLERRIGK